jgi:hypothetical protein
MVVARKRRKQTSQRVEEAVFSVLEKPELGRLEVFVDMNQSSVGNAGQTIAGNGPAKAVGDKR